MKKYKLFRGLNVLLGILAVVVVAIVGLAKSLGSEVYAAPVAAQIITTQPTKDNDYEVVVNDELKSSVTYQWYMEKPKSYTGAAIFSNNLFYGIIGSVNNDTITSKYDSSNGSYDISFTSDVPGKNIVLIVESNYELPDYSNKSGNVYTYNINGYFSKNIHNYSSEFYVKFVSVSYVEEIVLGEETGSTIGDIQNYNNIDISYCCKVSKNGSVIATSDSFAPRKIEYKANGAKIGSDTTKYQLVNREVTFNPITSYANYPNVAKGWATTSNATTALTSLVMPDEDIVLYMVWVPAVAVEPTKDNNYTVTPESSLTGVSYEWYKTNGTYSWELSGETSNTLGDTTLGDYSYYCEVRVNDGIVCMGTTQEITPHKATFYTGITGQSEIVKYQLEGRTINVTSPTKDNYTFAGWKNNNTNVIETSSLTMGDKDVTYTAQWNVVPHTCNDIVFDKPIDYDLDKYGLGTGNYYLTKDIVVNTGNNESCGIDGDSTVNICLNGHSITFKNGYFLVRGTLNIYDCSTTEHNWSADESGLYVSTEASASSPKTYGGIITTESGKIYSLCMFSMLSGSNLGIHNVDFVGVNTSCSILGGGSPDYDKCNVVFDGGTSFQGCVTTSNSMCYFVNSSITFENVTIKNNVCKYTFYIDDNATVKFNDNVSMSGNHNGTNGSGFVFVKPNQIELKNGIANTNVELTIFGDNDVSDSYELTTSNTTDLKNVFTLVDYEDGENSYYTSSDKHYDIRSGKNSDNSYTVYISKYYTVTYVDFVGYEKTVGASLITDSTHYHSGDTVTIKGFSGVKVQSNVNGTWVDADATIYAWYKGGSNDRYSYTGDLSNLYIKNQQFEITKDTSFVPVFVYDVLYYNENDGKFHYVNKNSTYVATCLDGMYSAEKDENNEYTILTFNNLDYSVSNISTALYLDQDLTLIFKGVNSITNTGGCALRTDDIIIKGNGTLNINGILGGDDLLIEESLTLNVTGSLQADTITVSDSSIVNVTSYDYEGCPIPLRIESITVEDNAIVSAESKVDSVYAFRIYFMSGVVVKGKTAENGEYVTLSNLDKVSFSYDYFFVPTKTIDGETTIYPFVQLKALKITQQPALDNNFEVDANEEANYQWYQIKDGEKLLPKDEYGISYDFEGLVEYYATVGEGNSVSITWNNGETQFESGTQYRLVFCSLTDIDIINQPENCSMTKEYDSDGYYIYNCLIIESEGTYQSVFNAPAGTILFEFIIDKEITVTLGYNSWQEYMYIPLINYQDYISSSDGFEIYENHFIIGDAVNFYFLEEISYLTFKSETDIDIEVINNAYGVYGINYTKVLDNTTGVYTYKTTVVKDEVYYVIVLRAPFGTIIYDISIPSGSIIVDGATNKTFTPTESGTYFVRVTSGYASIDSEEVIASAITFNLDGATGNVEGIVKFVGQKAALPGIGSVTKDGYSFVGWKLGENIYNVGDEYTFGDADVEFTAVWTNAHHYSTEWTIDTPATCTTAGSKSHHCTDEGCTEKIDVTSIEATGHNVVIDEAVAPTCTQSGKTEGKHCSACNEVFIAQEAISALGHSYSTEWTTDTAATCTAKGTKSHHCTVCDDKTDVTDVDTLEHTYGYWTYNNDATTSKDGTKTRECSVCHNKEIVTAEGTKKSTEIAGDSSSNPSVKVTTPNGFDSNVKIVVEVTAEAEVEEKINNSKLAINYHNIEDESKRIKNNEKIGLIYNVKLKRIVDGVETDIKLEDLKDTDSITVFMKIPENVDLSNVVRILTVKADKSIESIEFNATEVTGDGYYVTTVDELCEFVFIYKADKKLSTGGIVAIVLGSVLLSLTTAYVLGYFFLYRKGLLDDHKIRYVYAFLPRGKNK